MSDREDFDVVILGGGPAGCTAALRLVQLGYRVAVIEKQAFPRPNIGESLSPGTLDILEFLGAREILGQIPVRAGLPRRLIWESPEEQLATGTENTHAIVDRGQFDHALFRCAEERGARCFSRTTAVSVTGSGDSSDVVLNSVGKERRMRAQYLLNAGGRNARGASPLAPPLLALWCELPHGLSLVEVRIEAMPQGWLWGSPLPDGRYRVMAFCAPSTFRDGRIAPEEWFNATLQGSRLFRDLGLQTPKTCAAGPYVATDYCRPGRMKIGDAAFALDPLSSSGVEKAMRFSLQAVIAVNTLLKDPGDSGLAQEFLTARLQEAVARHTAWTEDTYGRAWPATGNPFWEARAGASMAASRFAGIAETPNRVAEVQASVDAYQSKYRLRGLLHTPLSKSPDLTFSNLPCAIGDRVQRYTSACHPRLPRPVAFVEGLALRPLIESLVHAADLSQWLSACADYMAPGQAIRIASWALESGLISASPSVTKRTPGA
jgi:flavin-dependent dehydrogenase